MTTNYDPIASTSSQKLGERSHAALDKKKALVKSSIWRQTFLLRDVELFTKGFNFVLPLNKICL